MKKLLVLLVLLVLLISSYVNSQTTEFIIEDHFMFFAHTMDYDSLCDKGNIEDQDFRRGYTRYVLSEDKKSLSMYDKYGSYNGTKDVTSYEENEEKIEIVFVDFEKIRQRDIDITIVKYLKDDGKRYSFLMYYMGTDDVTTVGYRPAYE